MINALGGITVNINTYIPIGGQRTDRNIPPDDYIEAGAESASRRLATRCGSPGAGTAPTTSPGWTGSAA